MNTTPFPALSAETLLAVNTVGQWLAQNDFPANNLIRRIASSGGQCGDPHYRRGLSHRESARRSFTD